MVAANKGHGAIVTYLVKQGANKDLQGSVSIHLRKMMMMMMIMMIMMLTIIMMMMMMMIVYMVL